jgi:hypothetical protein
MLTVQHQDIGSGTHCDRADVLTTRLCTTCPSTLEKRATG